MPWASVTRLMLNEEDTPESEAPTARPRHRRLIVVGVMAIFVAMAGVFVAVNAQRSNDGECSNGEKPPDWLRLSDVEIGTTKAEIGDTVLIGFNVGNAHKSMNPPIVTVTDVKPTRVAGADIALASWAQSPGPTIILVEPRDYSHEPNYVTPALPRTLTGRGVWKQQPNGPLQSDVAFIFMMTKTAPFAQAEGVDVAVSIDGEPRCFHTNFRMIMTRTSSSGELGEPDL